MNRPNAGKKEPTQHAPVQRESMAAIIQCVQMNPNLLSAKAVMQLQKTLGNHAMGRWLEVLTAPEEVPSGNFARAELKKQPAFVLQRKKGEMESAKKHRRIVRAKEGIKKLKGKIGPALEKHIFEGKPLDGEVDKDNPQGLHAYTNGRLPRDIAWVTEGSTGKVHSLTWHYNGKEKTKASTMFPIWMPKDHVNTLIVLDTQKDVLAEMEKDKPPEKRITAEDIKTYISRGQDNSIGGERRNSISGKAIKHQSINWPRLY